jgi:predicted acyl esterase
VVPGQVTRYDIEVFPTFDTIAQGHSLRVTVSSVDTPHLQPIPSQVANLIGGVYQIQRSPQAPSAIEVSLIGGR